MKLNSNAMIQKFRTINILTCFPAFLCPSACVYEDKNRIIFMLNFATFLFTEYDNINIFLHQSFWPLLVSHGWKTDMWLSMVSPQWSHPKTFLKHFLPISRLVMIWKPSGISKEFTQGQRSKVALQTVKTEVFYSLTSKSSACVLLTSITWWYLSLFPLPFFLLILS